MRVETRSPTGSPQCPLCHTPVFKYGEFCTLDHYAHFLVAVSQSAEIIEVDDPLLDRTQQSWHTPQGELS